METYLRQNENITDRGAAEMTIAPAAPGNTNGVLPEFGRWRDVERLFGIKRGALYLLIADGKIQSVSMRRRGNIHGCRLIFLASVRQYLHTLMQEQSGKEGTDQ